MKAICIFLSAFVILQIPAKAQNLLSNGGFENGLAGWTASGNLAVEDSVPVAQGSNALVFESTAGPTGIVSQTFNASPGAAYLLTYDYAATGTGINESLGVSVVDTNGDQAIATQVFANSIANSYHTFSALFIATTSSMTVTFQDQSITSAARDGLLDNIQIVSAPSFSYPGVYTGTVVESGSIYNGQIAVSKTIPIKMQITPAGQFFVIEMTSPPVTAVGTVSDTGGATLGNTGAYTGTATFSAKGGTIDITTNSSFGANFAPYAFIENRKYVLRKSK
jgi:hypothetical protein